MTKQELINAIAKNNPWGLTKKATSEVIASVFNNIQRAIKSARRFTYPGFGTWNVRNLKARKGMNPKTKKPITIKASKTVRFRPSKDLKHSL